MKVPFSWLQDFTDCRKRSEQELSVLLTMAGLEVEEIYDSAAGSVFEIGVTPNRPDCFSVFGVARDIAAVCNGKLSELKPKVTEGNGVIASDLRVDVVDTVACPRYAARKISGVKVGPSPEHIQARLEASGVRPINNVVDATNYVMLEYGQPMHAFDAAQLAEDSIIVRRAQDGETLVTLDEAERSLTSEDLVICDGQGPIAVAGVMGGLSSQVTESTTDIILESAYFAPTPVRRSSKRLGLSTESSRRFERGIDPNRAVLALHRVTELICEWAGGEPSADWYDLYAEPIAPIQVALLPEDITRLLGVSIADDEARGILKRLGMEVQEADGAWQVTVPTDRPDITRSADLVEEVARIYGYDRIPEVLPAMQLQSPELPARDQLTARLRERLLASGFSEAVHLAFEPAEEGKRFSWPGTQAIAMQNPLGQEPTVLKTSLAGGLVKAAAHNLRFGCRDLRLFELRPSYGLQNGECRDELRLAGVLMGARFPTTWTQAQDMIDFFDLRGVVEQVCGWAGVSAQQWSTEGAPSHMHPGLTGWLGDAAGQLGYAGALHPAILRDYAIDVPCFVFEFRFARLLEHFTAAQAGQHYTGMARYPGVRRDIALLVDQSVSAQAVTDAVAAMQEALVSKLELFDVYEGERLPAGKKSLAYAIYYQHAERTLTDDEVSAVHDRIVERLQNDLGAEMRREA